MVEVSFKKSNGRLLYTALFVYGRTLRVCQRQGVRIQIHFKFKSVQAEESLCLGTLFAVSQSHTCFTSEEEIPLRPGLVCSVTVAWEEANTWRSPVHHDTAKRAIVGQVTNPRYHVLGEEVHEIIL